MKRVALLLFSCLAAHAAQPQLRTLKVSIDPYPIRGTPIALYQSSLLGTTYSPFKKVMVWVTPPTNSTYQVIPGTYKFYCVALRPIKGDPYESPPSNMVTNIVK